jgi:hypothetical protein
MTGDDVVVCIGNEVVSPFSRTVCAQIDIAAKKGAVVCAFEDARDIGSFRTTKIETHQVLFESSLKNPLAQNLKRKDAKERVDPPSYLSETSRAFALFGSV